ncbi:MAG: aldo/keto reductase [Planctomycetaceae bacterium]|nr:aldo/keto reductase [Planctomycetaceae bacterium]MCP4463025.1 aldo/keto reductase [Planctomycetaceae bacterium]
MHFIELASGDKMPMLGLGTWKLSRDEAYDAVKTAIANGYRHIDCAWIYQNEADVGRALKECMDAGIVQRDELWVTSKLWNDRHHADHVEEALRESLSDLQLDYVDLYLIHWPVAHQFGIPRPASGEDFASLDQIPLNHTWAAMLECVEKGLCRNVGVSNFSAPKIQFLIESTGVAPACNQVESHPYLQQPGLAEFCDKHSIVFTAYSPLGSGDRPETMKTAGEPSLFTDPVLLALAEKNNLSIAQLMLAWAVNRGTVPIPKSANEDRQIQNLAAAAVELSDEDMQTIQSLDQHHRFIDGTFWEVPGSSYTVSDLWNE